MFIPETREEPEYQKRLTTLFRRCKCILSNNSYMDYLVEYITENNFDYVDNKISLLLQEAYIGISHYASENNLENCYTYSVNTEELIVKSYKVKYNDMILSFTEYDGEDIFEYRCSIDQEPQICEAIDFNDICEYYINFNPLRPHDKQRKLGEGR